MKYTKQGKNLVPLKGVSQKFPQLDKSVANYKIEETVKEQEHYARIRRKRVQKLLLNFR